MINNKLLQKTDIKIGNVLDGTYMYALTKIHQSTTKNIIFITSNTERARKLHKEISYFNSNTLLFPSWDSTPYDLVSPSKAILEERIKTLSELRLDKKHIVVTSIDAFLQKTIHPDILSKHTITIKKNDVINRQNLINFLIDNNYSRLSEANEPGEFSVRGSIIDIFANGEDRGFRLDFFDNKVEFIKKFDPTTQITTEKVNEIKILPSSEFIFSKQYLNKLKESMLNIVGSKINDLDIIQNINEGIKSNTIEQYLPLIYDCETLDSYINQPLFIIDKFIDEEHKNIFEKIHNLYKERVRHTKLERSILPPNHLWITEEEYSAKLQNNHVIRLELSKSIKQDISLDVTDIENFKTISKNQHSDTIQLLTNYMAAQYNSKKNVIISSSTTGSRDRIHRILQDVNTNCVLAEELPKKFSPHVHLIISPIENSYSCPEYSFITEKNIFGETIQKITRKTKSNTNSLNELYSFSLGDLVVHNEYGIAKFCGLETIELSHTKHDCIKLEYAAQNKLFIPVENINLITRYGSAESSTQLDSLGGTSWQIKKGKAKDKIKKSAEYLMKIAAQRNLKQADILEIPPGLYEEFCSTFPYVETEDQINAIEAIISDLVNGKPMDRLICGDTGFGKTEVALRAAFIAIKAGKQVSLICPTTLLAKQHFKSFKSRMEKFGIKVAQISRLVSHKESKNIIEDINDGKLDLVIGTHALLNDKIQFKNLGLLIIDEEQHFGVAQKEKLKKFKENIHILALSATPIPRTLQMSLSGIKELSLISTPPINRISTKTVIIRFDELVIKEALINEHKRDGQSFYICPRISDLEEIEKLLYRIVPNLKFKKVHGRMSPNEIDKIMGEFCDGEFDILLCTSIIESGIDIPTANTLIMHKSDQFGLGQMYQIKGRVGRSNIKSYAYFTFASNKAIKSTTINRLEILQKTEHLGAGFSVASYDMDMRGYGNLVGEEQSGHIKEIGVELYQNMLKEAVEDIKSNGEENPTTKTFTPQINLGIPVYIPENYIKDFDIRLNLYRRLGELENESEIQAFAAEMIDRFGKLPTEFENLFITISIKNLCCNCKISKIDASSQGFALTFLDSDEKQSEKILKFVINHPDNIKIKPDSKIVVSKNIEDGYARSIYIEKFIKYLREKLS